MVSMHRAKGANVVRVNVYDLSEQNYFLYWCGFGVFHTGIEVYGVEYAYGGHEYDASGIFATEPRKPPGPVEFRESIVMGETSLSPTQVRQMVGKMGKKFRGNKYHLLQMNCNHFASDLCRALIGKKAPSWINRLAGLAVLCHCLLPASWVPPLSTPSQLPDHEEISVPRKREEHRTLLIAPRSDDYGDADMILEEDVEVHVSQATQRTNGATR